MLFSTQSSSIWHSGVTEKQKHELLKYQLKQTWLDRLEVGTHIPWKKKKNQTQDTDLRELADTES